MRSQDQSLDQGRINDVECNCDMTYELGTWDICNINVISWLIWKSLRKSCVRSLWMQHLFQLIVRMMMMIIFEWLPKVWIC